MKRFLIFVALVILAVFLISRWNLHRSVPETFTPAPSPRIDLKDVQVLAALDEAYTRLVEAVIPSVVSLTTSRKMQEQQRVDPFEYFFGRRGRKVPREFVQNSLGSGVIVSKEGHILTNNHVVANVDEVKVQLRDGREFPAKIIGTDEINDIAVLKINAEGLVPLPLGDSDRVKVGSMVLAVGNPFGLQESVTQGIISATGRQVSDESGTEFFQTDTAINPGNSGGPLVNLRGEIIGINTAIGNYSGSGTWQGVGFAIPSNTVRRSLESIISTGRVVRGYLGVAMQELTPEIAAQLGVPNQPGALITGIAPGSPAEKAGLKEGDVVIAFNGKAIHGIRDLFRQVSSTPVGGTVEIKILRNKNEETLSATIEEQPDGFRSSASPQPRQQQQKPPQAPQGEPGPDNPLYGLETGPIPTAQRSELPANVHGVVITAVDPAAPAAEVLQPGDVIEEIGGQPVGSPAEFTRLVRSIKPGQRIVISIARGKFRSFVVIGP